MKNKPALLFILIIFIALAFRLPGLSFRTMHGDEAVNALKLSDLLEKGEYVYNPFEYHGPSLYYLTLPFTFFSSQNTLQQLDEFILRVVPVMFFIGLMLTFLIVKDTVGWPLILFSSVLVSISPIFVYYSRYYIHEMLFVFFTYVSLFLAFRLYRKPAIKWAVSLGACLALLIATKETWIIQVGSAGLTLIILVIFYPQKRLNASKTLSNFPIKVYLSLFISFLLVYATMFSSFFQNFDGLFHLFRSINKYLDKAISTSGHGHPWYQYFKWLMFSSNSSYYCSEGLIGLLALAGIYLSFRTFSRDSSKLLFFMRFIALFTIITTLIFSAILYKTPWNALSFWFGATILAGFTINSIFEIIKDKLQRNIFIVLLTLAIINLAWQSYQINYIEYESPDNPYTYAHPQKDIFRIIDPLIKISLNHPDKSDMHIQVIVSGDDYWPLPWYLRKYSKVGWWNKVEMNVPSADYIIASPDMEADLAKKFYEITKPGERDLYVPLVPDYVTLRPGVKLKAFITLKTRDLLNQ